MEDSQQRDAQPARSPAMTDVARAAHVSHQTVSRVLNGHPNVRPETRDRVLDAIKQLGYRPNLAARALATGRSNTLGLVTLDTMLLGPVATMYAVEQAARRAGYSVSIRSESSIDRQSLADSLSRLAQESVAGVIIIAPVATRDSALEALPADLPIVVVEAAPQTSVSAVTVDQQHGAYLATTHLLELGHGTVLHVSGPADWIEARERVAGWRRALEEAGIEPPPVMSGDWSAQSGYDAGRLIAQTPEITAVFAANDNMALGVLRALDERGRAVPDDVSLVGFDDIAEAAFFSPPLSTVRQDFSAMGSRSVEMLLRQLDSPGQEVERIVLAPELILRQSTARA